MVDIANFARVSYVQTKVRIIAFIIFELPKYYIQSNFVFPE